MKNKILSLALAAGVVLALVAFNSIDTQTSQGEEYALVVYTTGGDDAITRTLNGKTDYVLLDAEKIPGMISKSNRTSLVVELQKVSAMGYEIVNVATSVPTSASVREVYLFRKKK